MSSSFLLFFKKYGHLLVFCLLFLITLGIRCLVVGDYNIAFTPDQARDMLEIRQMAIAHSPKLLGPITDIIGLYLGPFWYYLNLLPFVVGGGDPQSLVYFSIATLHLSSLLLFIFLSKKDKKLGLLSSLVLLLSPVAFLTTRFSFNANAVFYFSTLFPLFFFYRSSVTSFLEGFLSGLILQLQAAIGILFFPISIFLHLKREKSSRHLPSLLIGFVITLIPQLIFEISHHFSMTKTLLSEFLGGSDYLGARLTLSQLINDRLSHFRSIFQNVSYLPVSIIIAIIIFALVIPKRNSAPSTFLKYNLLSLLVYLIFFLFFPFILKDWYLYGLVPFSIFSFASSLCLLDQYFKNRLTSIIVICFVIYTSLFSNIKYYRFVNQHPSDNPSNLKNMLTAIDKIYQDADNRGFHVFSYLPSVYDHAYQYLFWWYGPKKYGFQPSTVSYLPDVPEYIKNNATYWTKKKTGDILNTYLLIQHDTDRPDREDEWRKKFTPKAIKLVDFPWNITVERLNPI